MADQSQPPDESRALVPIPPAIHVYVGNHFETNQAFKSKEAVLKWAREVAMRLQFSIVVVRSDNGGGGRKQFIVLGCERGGKYTPTGKKPKKEETGTRKCECPFRLRGRLHATTNDWHVTVTNGMHNHALDKALVGHLVAGRLKPEEKQLLSELTRNLVSPKNIIATMKERDPNNVSDIKKVYNARYRFKQRSRASRTEMQQLYKCLDENNYFFKARTDGESDYVQDVFFAHPKSVCLLNTFPTVLLMDSTYKTNKYGMPLFEIVGETSCEETYSVGFAFMSNEKEENFTWVLQQCKGLLRSKEVKPKVIVTDRDAALMNAVATVFPESAHLVCYFHVKKNMTQTMKPLCKIKDGEKVSQTDLWRQIEKAFDVVLFSDNEEDYVDAVLQFRKLCVRWPRFVRYVDTTILDTDKHRCVSAWTNNYMHLGNTTTNRVEGSHGRLKGYLHGSTGDLATGWEAIDKMLINQFTELQATFGRNVSVVEHTFKDHYLYALLNFKVSRAALNHIRREELRVEECGMDSKKCGCLMRRTYGLPCACVIARKIKNNLPIRLDEVNAHWKKLCFMEDDGSDLDDDGYSCLPEWQLIQVQFN
jgi:hypothetical protein